MRGKAMSTIVSHLESNGINFSKLKALEFFARIGSWQTVQYSEKVNSLAAWEIDSQFEKELKRNLPTANIKIGDSFEIAKTISQKYDFIVFDNPQGVYGKYCEHFEALELFSDLTDDFGIVTFNVNKKPFDYNEAFNSEWKLRRCNYYGFDAFLLSTEFIIDFYNNKFEEYGFSVSFSFETQRDVNRLSYLTFGLSRKPPL